MHRNGPSRLRSAVIGCGAISHEHFAHLQSSPWTELAAVCDRSAAAAEFARERYGAAGSFTDAAAMLAEQPFDVVHIVTPPQTHVELVALALASGAHVIAEKPLAPTAAEVEDLLAQAGAAGRVLVETRNYLYNDPIVNLDALVASGRLGEVREVDVQLRLDLTDGPFGDLNLTGPGLDLPGAAVHDVVPHLAYLFLHFAGSVADVDEVIGTLRNLSGNPRVGADHLDALVRTGHVRGRLSVSPDVVPDGLRVVVRGTRGSAETDLFQPYLRVQDGRASGRTAPFEQVTSGVGLAMASVSNLAAKVLHHGSYQGVSRMLDDLYRAIASGADAPITPEQVLGSARLVDRLVALARPRVSDRPTS